ncbi:tRNA pseudouridine(38-40) synthase TruA [Bacteroidota bacterium]
MRYFLKLAYNGSEFHGWQMQDNAASIQQNISENLSLLLGETVPIHGCGRTDAGVHAKQFYAHFDCNDLKLEPQKLVFKLNSMLHKNIAIENLLLVNDDAHARFHAVKRTYEYVLVRNKNPFMENLAYRFSPNLDVDKMNQACKMLIGEKDFGCFCKANANNHTNICTVSEARWVEDGDLLKFQISANRFLRNMVRAVVGTMLEIGMNRISLNELKTILISGSRSDAGPSVPAHGLYLTAVEYPPEIFQRNP